jgi:hypothetical protein
MCDYHAQLSLTIASGKERLERVIEDLGALNPSEPLAPDLVKKILIIFDGELAFMFSAQPSSRRHMFNDLNIDDLERLISLLKAFREVWDNSKLNGEIQRKKKELNTSTSKLSRRQNDSVALNRLLSSLSESFSVDDFKEYMHFLSKPHCTFEFVERNFNKALEMALETIRLKHQVDITMLTDSMDRLDTEIAANLAELIARRRERAVTLSEIVDKYPIDPAFLAVLCDKLITFCDILLGHLNSFYADTLAKFKDEMKKIFERGVLDDVPVPVPLPNKLTSLLHAEQKSPVVKTFSSVFPEKPGDSTPKFTQIEALMMIYEILLRDPIQISSEGLNRVQPHIDSDFARVVYAADKILEKQMPEQLGIVLSQFVQADLTFLVINHDELSRKMGIPPFVMTSLRARNCTNVQKIRDSYFNASLECGPHVEEINQMFAAILEQIGCTSGHPKSTTEWNFVRSLIRSWVSQRIILMMMKQLNSKQINTLVQNVVDKLEQCSRYFSFNLHKVDCSDNMDNLRQIMILLCTLTNGDYGMWKRLSDTYDVVTNNSWIQHIETFFEKDKNDCSWNLVPKFVTQYQEILKRNRPKMVTVPLEPLDDMENLEKLVGMYVNNVVSSKVTRPIQPTERQKPVHKKREPESAARH